MTKAQDELRKEVEKINDAATIEKIRIFVAGILAQQTGDFFPPDKEVLGSTNQSENQCTLYTEN